MKKKMSVREQAVSVVAIVLLGCAFVALDRIWNKQIVFEVEFERCDPGYVRTFYVYCVPGYDPRARTAERRSVYTEFTTYGSAPFRRGDVR